MLGFLIKVILVLTITAKNPNYQLAGDYVSSSPKLYYVNTVFVGQNITMRDQSTASNHAGGNWSDTKGKTPGSTVNDVKRVYVHSRTTYLKAATLEAAFRKHNDFVKSGYVFTTEEKDADVIIEIERLPFTTEFPYSIINPRTHLVIGSGKVNSLGGTVAGKISSGFIKQIPAINAAIEE